MRPAISPATIVLPLANGVNNAQRIRDIVPDADVLNGLVYISSFIEAPGVIVRQKAGLNRSILDKGWGMFAQRLEHKARGRVEYLPAAYTSQRCSGCGVIASESRKSHADFCCVACGHTDNAV